MALTRDQILASKGTLKTKEIHVPEWAVDGDDVVILRELTGADLDAYQASLVVRRPALFGPNKGQMEDVPDNANAKAKFVAKVIVDADGNRLFTDSDVIALGELSASALVRVFVEASELNGLDDESVEEIEGNSGAAQSGSSTSA